jgi:HD superfamily phosphodiesterase
MNLTVQFESAGILFRQVLEDFFVTACKEKIFSSHGIEHHRRVWENAKQLTVFLANNNKQFSDDFANRLIIVCYMHDIGMSVDPGIKHGVHSRSICIRFLEEQNMHETEYKDVLEAIENHDKKDYSGNQVVNDLLLILSVADDLDAFGFTGIYRYAEIYLARGIPFNELGHRIQENAAKRFANFEKTFGFSEELLKFHLIKYNILIDFFREYNNQLHGYDFNRQKPKGYCGVIQIFNELIIKNISLDEFLSDTGKYDYDPVIYWFFDGLRFELNKKN